MRGPPRRKITPSPLPSLAQGEGQLTPALRAARWLEGVIRVLLIGCGDVAMRTADLLRANVRLYGLTRRPENIPKLRNHGITPIAGDLDQLRSLGRLRLAPFAVLHFAPPPSDGRDDPRTARLIAALTKARIIPQRFVYIRTSGGYGDCAGSHVSESRPRNAEPPRPQPRPAAPALCVPFSIPRPPGIFPRPPLPIGRLKLGAPVLRAEDDVYTNHI